MVLHRLHLLTLATLVTLVQSYAKYYADRDLSTLQYSVGQLGPMRTGNLQLGTLTTCSITSNVNPVLGYKPNAVYTVTVRGLDQRVGSANGGTVARPTSSDTAVLNLQWTAPADDRISNTSTFHAICVKAGTLQDGGLQNGDSYKTSLTVNQAIPSPTPSPTPSSTPSPTPFTPATCYSIPNAGTYFCLNNGNNGLIDASTTTRCTANPCTIANDAPTCCKAATNNNNNDIINGNAGSVAIELDTKMKVLASTTPDNTNDLKFQVTYQGTGWFAVGIALDGTMGSNGQGTDMVVCNTNGVQRYWSTSRSKPVNGVAVAGATCSTINGKSTMVFTRSWEATTPTQRSIARTGDTPFVYAYHASSKEFVRHTVRGTLTVKDLEKGLQTGTVDSTAIAPALLVLGHGGLMLLSWGFILPMGVAVAHFNRNALPRDWWFTAHKTLQICGWLLQLIGFFMVFFYKGNSHFDGQGIAELHMLLGGAVVLIGTLQPLNACFRPPKGKSSNRCCWEFVHKKFGYLAIFGGMINCVVAGFLLDDKYKGSMVSTNNQQCITVVWCSYTRYHHSR